MERSSDLGIRALSSPVLLSFRGKSLNLAGPHVRVKGLTNPSPRSFPAQSSYDSVMYLLSALPNTQLPRGPPELEADDHSSRAL